MSQLEGFFALQKPGDLLAKLRGDYERLERSPGDTCAAFDFFVTAYHMLDWLYPNDKGRREQEERTNTVLQVCSHIANGIKHFRATARKHQSVSGTRSERSGGFNSGAFNRMGFNVLRYRLFIRLDGQAAVRFGTEIECLSLASEVLKYWENHPDLK